MLTWSDTADSLLLTFCKKVSELYGSDCCTPNMHLHLRLKETLQDFGPAHATWCFSFERFNGILSSMPTNRKCAKIQFLCTFLRKKVLLSQTTTILEEDFQKVLPVSLSAKSTNTDTISCVSESGLRDLLKLHHGLLELSPFSYSDKSGLIQMLGLGKEQVFTSSETADMAHSYEQLNPGCAVVYVPPFYVRHGRIRIGSEVLGSALHGRSAKSSSVISAYWPTFLDAISSSSIRVGLA